MDTIIEVLDNSTNDELLHIIYSYQPIDYYISLLDHTFSQEWLFVGNVTYRSGKKHSFNDQPLINSKGVRYWFKNNKLHRDNDLPAVICSDGDQYWYRNDKLHRDNDLPAIIRTNDTQCWFKNDKLLSRVIKAA